jgi:hypothetical protein
MPRVIKCDKCQQNFTQQWVAAKKQWSQINQVSYWTNGQPWKSYHYFCRSCLNNWYEKDWASFKQLVEPKKQRLFIGYRSYGVFAKKDLTSYQPLEAFKAKSIPKIISAKKTCQHCSSLPLPLKVKCFRCQQDFLIKYVVPNKTYSKKNDWGYWTEQKGNHKICDACLRAFYYDKFVYWAIVKDPRKRNKMRVYIHEGIISKS